MVSQPVWRSSVRTILHFAAIVLRSHRNAQRGSVRHSDLKELANSVQGTLTVPSNAGSPNISVPSPAPGSTLRKICRRSQISVWICPFRVKAIVRNPCITEKALEKCQEHVNTSGIFDTNRIPFAVLLLYSRISLYWHQYKRRNQAVKTPLLWVELKVFLQKSLGDSKASVYTTWNRIR